VLHKFVLFYNIMLMLIRSSVLGIPYIGAIVKTYFKYTHLLILWYIKKWPVLAWLSYGKKNSQIILY